MTSRLRSLAMLAALLASVGGCTVNYMGAPSLSLVSTADSSRYYQPVGQVRSESLCSARYLFLFGSGDVPSHEAAIAKLLEKTGADVLLNAELTRDTVALLLYESECATVKGQPARLVGSSS